ncbi:hypothetical protein H9P43_006480 [Blastocladiella emersonii ATCC 22665]|nr:hypothetical protein H9P43_006480 [Blastocladiella emersonii ATCC 22665]
MQRLPFELFEDILAWAVRVDPIGTDPLPLLHVAPGLRRLRRTVLSWSLHVRVYRALKPDKKVFRKLLIQHSSNLTLSDVSNWNPIRFYVTLLSADGQVDLLDQWSASDRVIPHSPDYVDYASANGQVKVLDWFANRGEHMGYSERAVDDADLTDSHHFVDRMPAAAVVRCLLPVAAAAISGSDTTDPATLANDLDSRAAHHEAFHSLTWCSWHLPTSTCLRVFVWVGI